MASRKDRDEEEKPKAAVDRSAPEQDEDGSVEVKLEEAEDDEDDDSGGDDPAPAQERGPSNKQRRAQNYRETREKAQRLEQENAALRQQQEQYQAWLQSQQMQQQAQQAQQQSQDEMNKLFQEQEQAYVAFKAIEATATDAQIQEYKSRFQDIERRKFQAMLKANGGGQQLTPQQVMAINQRQQLISRYGDVLQHPQASGWALGTHSARVAAGEQDSEALRDEVAEEARRRFGMQSQVRRPAPSQAQRARLSGVSAGGRGAPPEIGGRTMQLSKDDQKMARSMYPKMKDAEAFRLYAANIAKQRAKRAAQKTG